MNILSPLKRLIGLTVFSLGVSVATSANPVNGVVTEVAPEKGTLTLRNDTGAVQTYFVGAGDLQPGYVGKTIRGEAVASGRVARLERIWPNDTAELKTVNETAVRLAGEVTAKRGSVFLKRGETVPDFALWNQHGQLVRTSDLRGKKLVINFIFSRCRNAKMCPLQSTQMAYLGRELEMEKSDDVRLLTLTFDPEYDTPGILKAYADAYSVDGKRHLFLTGPKTQIDALMRLFGIVAVAEDGTINHNTATLLVDARGKIVYRREGASWKPSDMLARLRVL